jgi:flagellar capping protein FliD
MLTRSDLQAIAKIIDEKINPLETRMGSFEGKLSSRDTKVDSLDKRIDALTKKMDRGFKSVDRKLNMIINYFDHQDIDVRKRLNRIELHLGLTPLSS